MKYKYVLICILAVALFVLIPQHEKAGFNERPLEIPISLYITDNASSTEDVKQIVSGANKIWDEYNITLKTDIILQVYPNLTKEQKSILFTKGNNETECIEYNSIINQIVGNDSDKNIKTIFLSNGESFAATGRGCICGCNFTIIDTSEGALSQDWVLAHEIGHILNVKTTCGSNLMIELDKCGNMLYFTQIRLFFPTITLTQTQVNEAVKSITAH